MLNIIMELKFKIRIPVKVDNDEFIGKRFGKLVVIAYMGKENGHYLYRCKCDCGNIITTRKTRLISGVTKSCGCYKSEVISKAHTKHGMYSTRLYIIWKNLRNRCDNPNNPKYNRYGKRGITYCKEWNDFSVFHDWAINNGYSEELTIDRINSNSNYSPDNCRWVDIATQEKNKDCNIFLEYKNTVYVLKDLAKLLNIPRNKLSDEYYNNDLDKYNIVISSYNKYVEQNGNTL